MKTLSNSMSCGSTPMERLVVQSTHAMFCHAMPYNMPCTYHGRPSSCDSSSGFWLLMLALLFPFPFIGLFSLAVTLVCAAVKILFFGVMVSCAAKFMKRALATSGCREPSSSSTLTCPLACFFSCVKPSSCAKPCPKPSADKQTQSSNAETETKDDAYSFTVDVPGIGQDDLTVTAHPWSARTAELPRITVAGQGACTGAKVDRTLVLPRDADVENVSVAYAHGQLRLSVPRAKKQSVRIVLKSAAAAPVPPPSPPATEPVLREVTPDAKNVQAPSDEGEAEWEPVPVVREQ